MRPLQSELYQAASGRAGGPGKPGGARRRARHARWSGRSGGSGRPSGSRRAMRQVRPSQLLYSPVSICEALTVESDSVTGTVSWLVRLGGWLFRYRTALPVPIAVVLLVVPAPLSSWSLLWIGMTIV